MCATVTGRPWQDDMSAIHHWYKIHILFKRIIFGLFWQICKTELAQPTLMGDIIFLSMVEFTKEIKESNENFDITKMMKL